MKKLNGTFHLNICSTQNVQKMSFSAIDSYLSGSFYCFGIIH